MKWLLLCLSLPVLLVAGALIANRPPIFESPGLFKRLHIYLTSNVAQTRSDNPLPELRPIRLQGSVKDAQAAVVRAMQRLGWSEIQTADGRVRALVTTRWLRFRDDVEVSLTPQEDAVLVQVRSASRVGRGDLAANGRHIMDLFGALGKSAKPD